MGASKRLPTGVEPRGFVRALNALTGELAWDFELHSPPWTGLMSTAGGLVFTGSEEGDFFALDAETGRLLWRFQTGGRIIANPISYEFEGDQYIAIAAGSALLTFKSGALRKPIAAQ